MQKKEPLQNVRLKNEEYLGIVRIIKLTFCVKNGYGKQKQIVEKRGWK